MAKVRVSYELEIPDGYELAYPEPRTPKRGEVFLDSGGDKDTAMMDFKRESYFILRPAWVWPAWLKARWIAMDSGGGWCAFDTKPYVSDVCWGPTNCFVELHTNLLDFTPPPCDDWKKSLRGNPNHVE